MWIPRNNEVPRKWAIVPCVFTSPLLKCCCCWVASVVSDSVRPLGPPGSPIPGLLQARTLEWVAISFSNAWKWKVKVKSLSRVQPSEIPWTAAYQAPPSMGFSRQQYWSGVPLPSPIKTCHSMLFIWQNCGFRHRDNRQVTCLPWGPWSPGSVHSLLQTQRLLRVHGCFSSVHDRATEKKNQHLPSTRFLQSCNFKSNFEA